MSMKNAETFKEVSAAIAEIDFDSDPIFKSDATEAILRDYKINVIWSKVATFYAHLA